MRRLSRESDLTAVFAIYMHPDVIPFLGYDAMPLSEFKEKVFSDLVKSGSFYVIEKGKEIVGFLKIARYPGRAQHVAYIGAFAIHPTQHGVGLGKSIMEDMIQELRKEAIKRIELIVESDNPKAIRFYQKLGFEIEGRLRKFYKRSDQEHYIDDYIMAMIFE